MRHPALSEFYLAIIRTHFNTVHAEVHEMAPAIGHITSAVAQCVNPCLVGKGAVQLGVDATLAHASVSNARKVSLAGNSRSEADVESVVPDVQLPDVRRVCGGDEIHRVWISNVHNVFVRPDSVETRCFIVRQLVRFDFKSKTGMREPHHRMLSLGPSQNGKVP